MARQAEAALGVRRDEGSTPVPARCAALGWAAAPCLNMAEAPRAPGRGLRCPRRAAAATEPPLLREPLAELRPRALAWGAEGSSRPAGGARRIPGGGDGGGERRECREYGSESWAAARPGRARLPPAVATPSFPGHKRPLRPPGRAPLSLAPRRERCGRSARAGL